MPARKYNQQKRAEQTAETKRRIVEATVLLHQKVGPAATQINEIARIAGVQRVTVYSHFPDQASLFMACSAHWRALHPTPDPSAWLVTKDAAKRRRLALRELYEWYRETEPMTANVLRDAQLRPALNANPLEPGLARYLSRVHDLLVETSAVEGEHRRGVDAAVWAAIGFEYLARAGSDRRSAGRRVGSRSHRVGSRVT